MSKLDSDASPLAYRRIRAPRDHGKSLLTPDSSQWDDLWLENNNRSFSHVNFQTGDFGRLQEKSRQEILQLANRFTRQHRDIDFASRDLTKIVMSGHQPTLFHAGVWFKNFVLSAIGKKFECAAINLIVDNDACTSNSISFPNIADRVTSLANIEFDKKGVILPFENREILDLSIFESFGNRASHAVAAFSKNPIIRNLWPYVSENSASGNLGLAIAQGRHRLEADIGLNTLELPVSHLANTGTFGAMLFEIVHRIEEFQNVYNEVVREYRRIHRIKNKFQPVPELKTADSYLEAPFWIWSKDNPQRRSLFLSSSNGNTYVSDLSGTEIAFRNWNELYEKLIVTDSILIRPKALMTTLYSRLFLSDMFIHGIGGAKYDQLTDEICQRFFAVSLPKYVTATGTYLIQSAVKPISKQHIAELQNQLRNIAFHPELFIRDPSNEVVKLIQEKNELVKSIPPHGQKKSWHDDLTKINQALSEFTQNGRSELKRKIRYNIEHFGNSTLLNSREFSFCLQETSLTDLLSSQAQFS